MAAGIFAILDDIAALMDDVAVASKIATTKTAVILGDDLAVNADKATGFVSSRELPVLWAITKGSLLNKAIIVPVALVLNYYFPVAIQVILVLGGLYLGYEGVEKIIHFFFHKKENKHQVAIKTGEHDASEKQKIRAAISTDFILSIEIVIIALGSVIKESLIVQIISVCVVAIVATIGVYGLVALIVRMDDAGYKLIEKYNNKGFFGGLGKVLVNSLPIVIRVLGVVGTIALVLVAGGIFAHNVPYFHHIIPQAPDMLRSVLFGLAGGLTGMIGVYIFKKLATVFTGK